MTYSQQQQAVILKGIASQILQMNLPSFDVVGKLFKEFDMDLTKSTNTTDFMTFYELLSTLTILETNLSVLRDKQDSKELYTLQSAVSAFLTEITDKWEQ